MIYVLGCMFFLSILALASLLMIRRSDGSIKPEGYMFFAVFMVGVMGCLALIVVG